MGKGFSQYDRKGNVIYSESIWKNGEKIRHFYQYDSQERRVLYKRIIDSEIPEVYEEYTTYYDNGTKSVYTYNNISKITNVRVYSNLGRLLSEKAIDINGYYTYKVYNQYTKRFETTTGKDLLYYTET